MKIIIKNPAPANGQYEIWGDHHFGCSLANALRAADESVQVTQQYWGQWDDDHEADAIIVLRGKRAYMPPRSAPSLLWVLSHPSSIGTEELRAYDHCYAASTKLARHFDKLGAQSVSAMYQCTDTRLFYQASAGGVVISREGEVLVGSSRGVRRRSLLWALEAGLPPALYGNQWDRAGMAHLVQADYVKNEDLTAVYRSARFVLNDHWEDMREFGCINNRIFDCMATGSPVISDTFDELEEVMGDSVIHCRSAEDYREAVLMPEDRYVELIEKVGAWWQTNGEDFTFDARAREILADIKRLTQQRGTPQSLLSSDPAEPKANTQALQVILGMRDQWATVQQKTHIPRLLHLCPRPALHAELAPNDNFHYLSSGPGLGPWQVSCERNFGLLAGRFELIVFENPTLLENTKAPERFHIAESLVSKLAETGLIALGESERNADWSHVLVLAGCVKIESVDNWQLFRGPSAKAANCYPALRAVGFDDVLESIDEAMERLNRPS